MRKRVVITGIDGVIGRVLSRGLREQWQIAGVDRRGLDPAPWSVADVADLDGLVPFFRDAESVVHLAACARVDASWSEVFHDNILGTRSVFEAARRSGVRKVVFASSNHVTGLYERDPPYADVVAGRYDSVCRDQLRPITHAAEIRPDGEYGVSKACGEALGRYYADAFGLQVFCLRIGTVRAADRPESCREFATLLTHRDLVALVDICLRAAEPRFGIFYGVSHNTWRFWDLEHPGRVLGWVPQENAERFRSLQS